MGMATLVGALLGFGVQIYSNTIRKLPMSRHPWEHVLMMGLGASFTNALVVWEDKLAADLDEMLKKNEESNRRRFT